MAGNAAVRARTAVEQLACLPHTMAAGEVLSCIRMCMLSSDEQLCMPVICGSGESIPPGASGRSTAVRTWAFPRYSKPDSAVILEWLHQMQAYSNCTYPARPSLTTTASESASCDSSFDVSTDLMSVRGCQQYRWQHRVGTSEAGTSQSFVVVSLDRRRQDGGWSLRHT